MGLWRGEHGGLDDVINVARAGLFDRADANKDGVVTHEELVALFQKETVGGGRGGCAGRGPGALRDDAVALHVAR